MISDDVRRLLMASGTDQGRVLWHDGPEAPTGPSHRWIAWTVGDEIVLGGADRGRFAAYARFDDPSLVAEILTRWVSPTLPPAPRDADTLVGAALVLVADYVATYLLPVALPTGVITGAVGAPYLLWLLVTSNREGSLS